MSDDSQQPSDEAATERDSPEHHPDRRDVLSRVAMLGGIAAGYGTCGAVAARYLYPQERANTLWQLVSQVTAIEPGASLTYLGPAGQTIAIARTGTTGSVEDFIALSTVCPHLGCQVHWQGPENRFICPCHNGVFDAAGTGIDGPPAAAGQSLSRYPLRVEDGLLFIEVPAPSIGSVPPPPKAEAIALANGRDACLGPQPPKKRYT